MNQSAWLGLKLHLWSGYSLNRSDSIILMTHHGVKCFRSSATEALDWTVFAMKSDSNRLNPQGWIRHVTRASLWTISIYKLPVFLRRLLNNPSFNERLILFAYQKNLSKKGFLLNFHTSLTNFSAGKAWMASEWRVVGRPPLKRNCIFHSGDARKVKFFRVRRVNKIVIIFFRQTSLEGANDAVGEGAKS